VSNKTQVVDKLPANNSALGDRAKLGQSDEAAWFDRRSRGQWLRSRRRNRHRGSGHPLSAE